jgi:Transposase, Mutator family
VISLSAKGLTTGEIAAHLAGVYGAEVSKQTISTITHRVLEGMVEWQSRPLDPGLRPVAWTGARLPRLPHDCMIRPAVPATARNSDNDTRRKRVNARGQGRGRVENRHGTVDPLGGGGARRFSPAAVRPDRHRARVSRPPQPSRRGRSRRTRPQGRRLTGR